MKKSRAIRLLNKGFTLVELSIVIVVIGLLIAAAISTYDINSKTKDIENTEQKLDAIEEAIAAFQNKYGYIPCPASLTIAKNSATYATSTDCSAAAASGTFAYGSLATEVRTGAAPTRTLNLPDSYAVDEWGNKFTYAVIADLAIDEISYDTYTSADTNGVIRILDDASADGGSQILDMPSGCAGSFNCPAVAYTIISHGKSSRGSYTSSTQAHALGCSANSDDLDNCNSFSADTTFVEMEMNENTISSNSNDFYDDLIRWKTLAALTRYADLYDIIDDDYKKCGAGIIPSDVVAWYDASDPTTITLTSDRVSQVDDKSGNGYHLTQGTSTRRPGYYNTFNNLKVLSFEEGEDAFDDTIYNAALAEVLDGDDVPMSIFGAVFPYPKFSDGIFYSAGNAAGTVVHQVNTNSGGTSMLRINRNGTIRTAGIISETPYIYSEVFTGTTNSIYKDSDALLKNTPMDTALLDFNYFRLGSDQTLNNGLRGDIGEVIVFDRAVTSDERRDIECYLRQKWIDPTDKNCTSADVTTSNMVAWYRADSGIVLDGGDDDVYQWLDQSGNGYTLLGLAASNRPDYDYYLNAIRIPTFNGSTNYLVNNSVGAEFSGNDVPLSMFGVARVTKNGSTLYGLEGSGAQDKHFARFDLDTGTWVDNERRNTAQKLWAGGTMTAEKFLYSEIFGGQTSNIYRNGVRIVKDQDFDHGVVDFTTSFRIGHVRTIGNLFGGDMAELIFYNSALSDTDRKNVECYLSEKWGIPLQ